MDGRHPADRGRIPPLPAGVTPEAQGSNQGLQQQQQPTYNDDGTHLIDVGEVLRDRHGNESGIEVGNEGGEERAVDQAAELFEGQPLWTSGARSGTFSPDYDVSPSESSVSSYEGEAPYDTRSPTIGRRSEPARDQTRMDLEGSGPSGLWNFTSAPENDLNDLDSYNIGSTAEVPDYLQRMRSGLSSAPSNPTNDLLTNPRHQASHRQMMDQPGSSSSSRFRPRPISGRSDNAPTTQAGPSNTSRVMASGTTPLIGLETSRYPDIFGTQMLGSSSTAIPLGNVNYSRSRYLENDPTASSIDPNSPETTESLQRGSASESPAGRRRIDSMRVSADSITSRSMHAGYTNPTIRNHPLQQSSAASAVPGAPHGSDPSSSSSDDAPDHRDHGDGEEDGNDDDFDENANQNNNPVAGIPPYDPAATAEAIRPAGEELLFLIRENGERIAALEDVMATHTETYRQDQAYLFPALEAFARAAEDQYTFTRAVLTGQETRQVWQRDVDRSLRRLVRDSREVHETLNRLVHLFNDIDTSQQRMADEAHTWLVHLNRVSAQQRNLEMEMHEVLFNMRRFVGGWEVDRVAMNANLRLILGLVSWLEPVAIGFLYWRWIFAIFMSWTWLGGDWRWVFGILMFWTWLAAGENGGRPPHEIAAPPQRAPQPPSDPPNPPPPPPLPPGDHPGDMQPQSFGDWLVDLVDYYFTPDGWFFGGPGGVGARRLEANGAANGAADGAASGAAGEVINGNVGGVAGEAAGARAGAHGADDNENAGEAIGGAAGGDNDAEAGGNDDLGRHAGAGGRESRGRGVVRPDREQWLQLIEQDRGRGRGHRQQTEAGPSGHTIDQEAATRGTGSRRTEADSPEVATATQVEAGLSNALQTAQPLPGHVGSPLRPDGLPWQTYRLPDDPEYQPLIPLWRNGQQPPNDNGPSDPTHDQLSNASNESTITSTSSTPRQNIRTPYRIRQRRQPREILIAISIMSTLILIIYVLLSSFCGTNDLISHILPTHAPIGHIPHTSATTSEMSRNPAMVDYTQHAPQTTHLDTWINEFLSASSDSDDERMARTQIPQPFRERMRSWYERAATIRAGLGGAVERLSSLIWERWVEIARIVQEQDVNVSVIHDLAESTTVAMTMSTAEPVETENTGWRLPTRTLSAWFYRI